jgi:8-oxo-dGTP pyrophosphatase MutT (NUDIX family)
MGTPPFITELREHIGHAELWLPGVTAIVVKDVASDAPAFATPEVLLVRRADDGRWTPVCGIVDPGEEPHAAAVREVREETGLLLDDAALVGPVLTRSALFDFYAEHCRQDEEFFLARVADAVDTATIARDGWTEVELDVLDELRWWALDDLASETREVFPEGLPDLVRPLLAGWDGSVRHLGLQRDD